MKTTKKTIAEVAGDLAGASSILILSHENPDGDAIGSALGLALGLKTLHKRVTVANVDGVPEKLSWLPGAPDLLTGIDDFRGYDTILLLDCAERERTGFDLIKVPEERFITIDHHPGNEGVGRHILIDTTAAATGELILEVLLELGVKVEEDAATNLYVAIHTDTGGFNYSNTSPRTHMSASILLDRGVKTDVIFSRLFENERLERIALLGRVLSTLALHLEGRVATCLVTREMLKETGSAPEDSDNFVNYPRSINGVEVAALLKERDEGVYRVSLRANTGVDLSSVAKTLGGGGHKKAAGATIEGDLETVTETLLNALSAAFKVAAS